MIAEHISVKAAYQVQTERQECEPRPKIFQNDECGAIESGRDQKECRESAMVKKVSLAVPLGSILASALGLEWS
jgi:hypothetical protein